MARACFFTPIWRVPFEHKMDGVALFAANQPLHSHHRGSGLRRAVFRRPRAIATPRRSSMRSVGALRADGALKAAAARFGSKFLNHPQALLHGDLHSGSVMVTESRHARHRSRSSRSTDRSASTWARSSATCCSSWYSQPGHASAQDDRRAHRRGSSIRRRSSGTPSAALPRPVAQPAAAMHLRRRCSPRPGDATALEAARETLSGCAFRRYAGLRRLQDDP